MQTFEVKFDFERLRTNIDSQDMQDSIMHMVREIFAVKEHEGFVGIKVRTKSHAQWLKQSPIPACNRDRFSDKDGESVTFDVLCIEEWLTYLSRNMYVTFGRIVKRQVQSTPMGTNCASNLANIFLAWYEVCFLRTSTPSTILEAVCKQALVAGGLLAQPQPVRTANILDSLTTMLVTRADTTCSRRDSPVELELKLCP